MKKLVVRLILLPILLIVAVFALANRQNTELSLWPLPWEAQAPMFIVLLATLLIGILIGAGLSWTRGRVHRSAAREHRRHNERLQRQLDALKLDAAKARPLPPAVALSPVVPPNRAVVRPFDRAIDRMSDRMSDRVSDRVSDRTSDRQPPPSFTPVNRSR